MNDDPVMANLVGALGNVHAKKKGLQQSVETSKASVTESTHVEADPNSDIDPHISKDVGALCRLTEGCGDSPEPKKKRRKKKKRIREGFDAPTDLKKQREDLKKMVAVANGKLRRLEREIKMAQAARKQAKSPLANAKRAIAGVRAKKAYKRGPVNKALATIQRRRGG